MHAGKTLGWAGATPLLTAFSRPKGLWGRSRPPRAARGRVLAACRSRSKHFVMQALLHHE